MSARGIIGGLAGMAVSAVKHPKSTTEQTLLAAKQMATTGTIVADKLLKRGKEKATGPAAAQAPAQVRQAAATATASAAEKMEQAAGKVEVTAEKVADRADTVERRAEKAASAPAATKAPSKKAPTKKSPAKKAPATSASEETSAATSPTKKSAAKKAPAKKAPAKKAPAKKAQSKKDDHDVVLSVDFPAPPEEPPVDVVGEALAKEAEEEQAGGAGGSVLPPVRDKDEAAADPATLKAVRSEAEMMRKAASPRRG